MTKKVKLKALSLFANVGIAEAYLESIGVHVAIANELLPERAKFYSSVYPKTHMIQGDITQDELRTAIIEEAKANLEAEKLNAQAEIERAKGAAEAIRIENGSITPAYIQYLWVRQQNANVNNKIIYIPTEAGLPILEAGRMSNK